jgi:release factor glutamine methyltransferase
VATLVSMGLERHEARWLVEEFLPGGDLAEMPTVVRAAQRRLDGEPLQYIIGHWPFRSLDLDVDPRVLIPRPETEELVSVALREVAPVSNAPLILDLGCGSGAIGLALVSELRERGVVASLVALDESLDALAVARRNAVKHQLLSVSFVHSTWFRALDDSLRGRVDAIVTNPPYVGAGEFETLDDVLRYEPRGALVAPDHQGYAGLEDIATILEEGLEWLTPGGVLVMEHGEHQRDVIIELARDAGWSDVVDHDDLNGRPRILVGRRPW